MSTWDGDGPPPAPRRFGFADWGRVVIRGLPMALVVFGGLVLLLLLRLVERPLFGLHRPLTPHITTFVCRIALALMGLPRQVTGTPLRAQGAQVANHASWLDIFVLNSCQQVYFVSKSEVAGWPGIGWLARATGTLFIRRDRSATADQAQAFHARLRAGHHLILFPEGTSSDSRRVLPFKSSLFSAFFQPDLREDSAVQPVTVVYHAPDGVDPRFYGWWGDMEFGGHFLQMLAQPRHGRVEVMFHDPIPVRACANRKELAKRCEAVIRAHHPCGSDQSARTSDTDSPASR
ncbi:lysophospholipid acyltransferase family protein [Dinoroseobacter sp. S124A]|uniref:lysophospholipid acyltransferase family protein n=1 Tax=Dinoroseobacter sp. S124A TaxID=3415128 RepID=UPI003C7E5D55